MIWEQRQIIYNIGYNPCINTPVVIWEQRQIIYNRREALAWHHIVVIWEQRQIIYNTNTDLEAIQRVVIWEQRQIIYNHLIRQATGREVVIWEQRQIIYNTSLAIPLLVRGNCLFKSEKTDLFRRFFCLFVLFSVENIHSAKLLICYGNDSYLSFCR